MPAVFIELGQLARAVGMQGAGEERFDLDGLCIELVGERPDVVTMPGQGRA